MASLVALLPRAASASMPELVVYKDPFCGCCEAWALAFADAGFSIDVKNEDDMDSIKARLNVAVPFRGCHTATIEGYYLEGHVPLEAAQRLLRERPSLAGLCVAGMPRGSLGMGDDPDASYDVIAMPRDGSNPFVYLAIRPK